ncbi:MAG TPA: hypothetical protein VNV37_09200, partial [Solirubrobacteraceae bacterium]|nr:hypothetical protein [Solirubrobacteraceae bacterium]
RPYVDGTENDSMFAQVFEYNGISRFGGGNVYAGVGHPAPFLVRLAAGSVPTHRASPGPTRLLAGVFGRDDGWLLPAAAIAAAAILLERRRASRRDPLRAAVVLWGMWLLVMAAFFSAGGYPNSYYVAALTPATGALCGAGLALAWRYRGRRAAPAALAGALVCCVGYGIYLLRGGTAVPGWLVPAAIALGVVGALALWAPRHADVPSVAGGSGAAHGARHVDTSGEAPRDGRRADRFRRGFSPPGARTVAFAAVCMLLLPSVAAVLMVTRGLGPFAAPYEPASATVSRAQAQRTKIADEQVIEQLASTYTTPIPLVTDSSILAAPLILATGEEVLPIGGYQGGIPEPTLARLQRYVAAGEARAFEAPIQSEDPRIEWVHAHCATRGPVGGGPTALYVCGG